MVASENVQFVGFFANRDMVAQLKETAKSQGYVSASEFIRATIRERLATAKNAVQAVGV